MQFSGPRPSESSDLVLVGRSSGYEQSHARMPERSERTDCLDGPLDDPGSSPACIHAAPFLFAHIHVTVYRWSARFVIQQERVHLARTEPFEARPARRRLL